MTTKSPTSTCGAYWGLCFPRSSCAVWLASRPSTTSVASMTCQARLTSPGLGVYVRTALVSSVVVGKAGGFASPSTGDGATRGAPAGSRAPADHDTSRPPAAGKSLSGPPSADLAEPPGVDVVHRAADLTRQEVRALPDQPHRLPDVVVDVGERPRRPWRPAPGRLLDQVGEADVVGRLETALGVVHQDDLAGPEQVLGDGQRPDGVLGDHATGVADDVGVTDLEPQQAEQRHPGVHAGDHGHSPRRADRLAAGELPRPPLVRREHPVDLGHPLPPSICPSERT